MKLLKGILLLLLLLVIVFCILVYLLVELTKSEVLHEL